MLDILTGEFFWGIVVGLLLSFFGGWVLAKFTVSMTQANAKKLIIRFCIDTIRNIQNIIREMDSTRDRTKGIHHDFLSLLDVEITIYGRNREHLIHLPDDERNEVRKFMNDVAVKKAEVANQLDQFYRLNSLADQIQAEGRGLDSERVKETAMVPLRNAQTAADRLVTIGRDATPLVDRLSRLK
jgi:hypothetical protein